MAFFANEPDDKGVQACPVGMCRVVPESAPSMFGNDSDAYERYMGRWSRLIAPAFL